MEYLQLDNGDNDDHRRVQQMKKQIFGRELLQAHVILSVYEEVVLGTIYFYCSIYRRKKKH